MAKDKSPRKPKRRVIPTRRRVTMWLSVETADKLSTLAAHRKVDLGKPVEEALKPILGKFYVVDTSAPVELAVVGADEERTA